MLGFIRRDTTLPPWQYPLWGIVHLWSSPTVLKRLFYTVLVGLTVAVTVLVLLLIYALTPQAQLFAGGRGHEIKWWSYTMAVVAVLLEASLLSLLLLKLFRYKFEEAVFVQTMKDKGQWKPGMTVEGKHAGGGSQHWNNVVAVSVEVLTMGLNFMFPVLGTIFYAILNGPLKAWDYMEMYMDAKDMSPDEQRIEIMGRPPRQRSWLSRCCCWCSCWNWNWGLNSYGQFGAVCVLLELVPIAGPTVFCLTNACGAALLASDLEANGGPVSRRPPPDSKTKTL